MYLHVVQMYLRAVTALSARVTQGVPVNNTLSLKMHLHVVQMYLIVVQMYLHVFTHHLRVC
jgi:hypothetical protein